MAAIVDQYDPLIKHCDEDAPEFKLDIDCLAFCVIMCLIIWLMIKCVISATETVKIPIRLDYRLSRLIPINASVRFEHEGTKYEIVFENTDEAQSIESI